MCAFSQTCQVGQAFCSCSQAICKGSDSPSTGWYAGSWPLESGWVLGVSMDQLGGSVDEVSQETHGLNFSGRILTLNPTTEASVKAQVWPRAQLYYRHCFPSGSSSLYWTIEESGLHSSKADRMVQPRSLNPGDTLPQKPSCPSFLLEDNSGNYYPWEPLCALWDSYRCE